MFILLETFFKWSTVQMYKKYEHKSTIQIEKYHIETLFLIIVNGSDELYIHTIKTKKKN